MSLQGALQIGDKGLAILNSALNAAQNLPGQVINNNARRLLADKTSTGKRSISIDSESMPDVITYDQMLRGADRG
jgi:hypothetical protein